MKCALSWGACAVMASALLASSLLGLGSRALAQVFTEPMPQPRPSQPKPRPRPQPSATPSVRASVAPPAPVRRSSFNDPVPYCAANLNSEGIGPSYVGQPMPSWISSAIAPSPTAAAQSQAYNWRCMNGRVLACVSSAEQSSCTKPSQEKEPTPELLQYCAGKRNAPIPANVVGNSVPIWACRSGRPIVSGYRAGLDVQGYFTDQWQDVTDYSPANMIGVIPRTFVGSWEVSTKGGGLLSFQYRIFVVFYGGRAGSAIGQADYHQLNTSDGQPARLCSTQLYQRGSNPRVLELEEQFSFRTPNIACPVKGRLVAQHRDGRLWLEWRKPGDGKVTLSGWGQRN